MDMKQIGQFLSQLRRERGMTQEQLGEKLGVTNKTVSRWENGNYLPPAEMLQALSQLYGITINEILSGTRLQEGEYIQKAEENIKSALSSDSFTLEEKIDFYKKKWKKDHWAVCLTSRVLLWGFLVVGIFRKEILWSLLYGIFSILYYLIERHHMMIYVERRAFDPPLERDESDATPKTVDLSQIRLMALILLGLAVWICIDLGINYISAFVPEINDGITVRGFWSPLFFSSDGDGWSKLNYFHGFVTSLKITAALGIGNILLACIQMNKEK